MTSSCLAVCVATLLALVVVTGRAAISDRLHFIIASKKTDCTATPPTGAAALTLAEGRHTEPSSQTDAAETGGADSENEPRIVHADSGTSDASGEAQPSALKPYEPPTPSPAPRFLDDERR